MRSRRAGAKKAAQVNAPLLKTGACRFYAVGASVAGAASAALSATFFVRVEGLRGFFGAASAPSTTVFGALGLRGFFGLSADAPEEEAGASDGAAAGAGAFASAGAVCGFGAASATRVGGSSAFRDTGAGAAATGLEAGGASLRTVRVGLMIVPSGIVTEGSPPGRRLRRLRWRLAPFGSAEG